MQQHEGFSRVRHPNQWFREGNFELTGFSRYQQTQDLLHFMQVLKGLSENLSQLELHQIYCSHLFYECLLLLFFLLHLSFSFPQLNLKKNQNPKPQKNIITQMKNTCFQGNLKNQGLNFYLQLIAPQVFLHNVQITIFFLNPFKDNIQRGYFSCTRETCCIERMNFLSANSINFKQPKGANYSRSGAE